MSYNKITSFAVKDTMADANPLKVVRGKEFDDEFDAIAVATATQEALLAALVTTPTGGVLLFAGVIAPADFLMCDGTAKSRSTYAALFQIIGTAFGAGDGGTTFNVPNLVGRFPYGAAGGQLGQTGGSADSTLPYHSHGGSISSAGAHNHSVSNVAVGPSGYDDSIDGASSGANANDGKWSTATTSTAPDHAHTLTISAAGVSAVNTNLPPFLRMNFIIKT